MKRIISIIISAVLVLSLFAACGKQEPSNNVQASEYKYTHRELEKPVYIEPAGGFDGGDGSENSPYEISSAEQWAFLVDVINNSDNGFSNEYHKAYYVLTKDIQLNDTANYDAWNEKAPAYSWKTIDATGISLVLDGKGHTISGLYINDDNTKSRSEYGLFGTFGGTIKNLKLDKAYISVSGDTCYVGTLAGYLTQKAVIENCTVDAVIDCYDNEAGGLVGYAAGGFVGQESDEIRFPLVQDCVFEGEINQIKEKSLNIIGGIVASGSCEISGCVNNGTIKFGGEDVDKVGGIIGMSGFGRIVDCVNNGELLCSLSEDDEAVVGSVAGGIVGNAFQSATGTVHMSRGLTVENCVNNGRVSSLMNAGGIAGEASNDNNEWCLTFTNCENNGDVSAKGNIGGIIGLLNCSGKNVNGNNVVVEKCINNASLKQGTPGGIIGSFTVSSGDAVIKYCKNSGDITATKEQNAGGIISYWLAMNETDARITVENCENSGEIRSTLNAGGIFGFVGNNAYKGATASSSITVTGCKNSGNIIAEACNGFVGGISANWGMENISTIFANCENTGDIRIESETFDASTAESEIKFTLSRICGGIVGRVGSGLFLTVDNDNVDADNVNNKNAVIVFDGCVNTGKYSVSDEQSHGYKDGTAVYKNFFGGIVGNTAAQDGFSILVKDCKYSGFERGLGNDELPDVGEKF